MRVSIFLFAVVLSASGLPIISSEILDLLNLETWLRLLVSNDYKPVKTKYLPYPHVASNLNIGDFNSKVFFDAWIDDLADFVGQNSSDTCTADLGTFLNATIFFQPWAWKMIDAFGKLPAGVADGAFIWLGSFDECRAVKAVPPNETSDSQFDARYCLVTVGVPNNNSAQQVLFSQAVGLSEGICIPNSCNQAFVSDFFKTVLSKLPLNETLTVNGVNCAEEAEYDWRFYLAVVILSLIGILIVVGTSLDIFLLIQKMWYSSIYESIKIPSSRSVANEYTPILQQQNADGYQTIGNSEMEHRSLERRESHMPGVCCKLFLCWSIVANGTKLLTTHKTTSHLDCVHGIRFLSMSWVILGHTFAFSAQLFSFYGNLVHSFSIVKNGTKILTTRKHPGQLDCVHGIRFFSMSWVILGHSYYFFYVSPLINNPVHYPEVVKKFGFQAIANGTYSVDTFFLLSGLLVGYLTLKEMSKNNGKIFWPMYYFHRFWRLTPVYMLLLMVDVCLIRYVANGPMWPKNGFEKDFCVTTWWTNLLYINNLYKYDEMCMGWSWYLSNDMQFFILSPLVLVPLYKSAVAGLVIIMVLMLGCCLSAGLTTSLLSLPSNLAGGNVMDPNAFMQMFDWVYIKPWSRSSPYLVGLLVGYLLFKTNCRIRLKTVTVIVGWILAAFINLSILYAFYGTYDSDKAWSDSLNGFYAGVSRMGWSIGVAWVIFACVTGYGGFVNTILSWGALIPLSRLTYCAYLIHPMIMFAFYFSRRQMMHWSSHMELVMFYLGFMVLSYMTAFVASLALESPPMALEKIIFSRQLGKRRQEDATVQSSETATVSA